MATTQSQVAALGCVVLSVAVLWPVSSVQGPSSTFSSARLSSVHRIEQKHLVLRAGRKADHATGVEACVQTNGNHRCCKYRFHCI